MLDAGCWMLDNGQSEWGSRNCGDFAGNADDAVEVGAVGSDFQVVDDVARGAAKKFGERLADVGIFTEDEESIDLIGKAQFLRGAHHALGFDAANFADLDCKGLFARFSRQSVAGEDEGDFIAGFEIVRTADDLAFAFAVVDAAKRELVSVWVFLAGEDLGDNDAVEIAAKFLNAFDFDAEHGEPFGQLLGRPVEIDVLFEPVKGDFHVLSNALAAVFLQYLLDGKSGFSGAIRLSQFFQLLQPM